MAIEKIGSVNPIVNHNTRVAPKTPLPVPENPGVKPSGKTEEGGEPKDLTKFKDPPFFPIGDTWSIFKQ